MVGEKLYVELQYDSCALERLLCIIRAAIDLFHKLRVKVLVETVLTLFLMGRLFHSLLIYGFSDLVRCCLFDNWLQNSFFTARSDFAGNAMSVSSAWSVLSSFYESRAKLICQKPQ